MGVVVGFGIDFLAVNILMYLRFVINMDYTVHAYLNFTGYYNSLFIK